MARTRPSKEEVKNKKKRSLLGGKMARKQLRVKEVRRKKEQEQTKKPRRWHSGTVALRKIRKIQRSTDPLIKMKPFRDIVEYILHEHCTRADHKGWRKTLEALDSAREYIQNDLLGLLRTSNIINCANGKKTLDARSINTVLFARRNA